MRTAAGTGSPGPALPERSSGVVGAAQPDGAAQPAGRAAGPSRAEQRLATLILAQSQRGGPGSGSRLPTERQLAVDLGVTRSSVRHALALLEAQGRISREVGRGTFLRDPAQPPAAPAQPEGGAAARAGAPDGAALSGPVGGDFAPADVMTVRRLLEPASMPLVVAWATAADLDAMDHCLDGGDHAVSYEEFEGWDLALHRCIMRSSRSPLLAALYGAIEQARHGQVWGDLKRRSSSTQHRQEYREDHRAIVGALRARDSAAAVEAMRLHLTRVSEHLLATGSATVGGWG
ncbi:MAG TPA: FCD domain-containing protein [Streptosporangiaceae bacterium]|nr:FCD domain-containing protein [Streptosporangiaceae bacterium]